ncbi:MAG: sigma-70 family RNA polymerase sigma factor [Herbiconiux sp.]|nr:sigma-70 family RNA polymerase sigma factor [Herbiconiux sp.]
MPGELEAAFREEWPRILGSVLRFTGDLQLAEDAVQEAFVRALAQPAGVLRNPASWITTAAKRIAVDTVRRDAGLARSYGRVAADLAVRSAGEAVEEGRDPFAATIDDERLELLFLACHPELPEEARLALALRTVCGVPTEQIAELLLVKRATVAARLTRAKKRIVAAGLRFEPPDGVLLAERADDVLTIVHLLYTAGHTTLDGPRVSSQLITAAALSLARSMVRLLPRHLEARGLLGLVLCTEARAPGRTDDAGRLLSLEEADRSRWDRSMLEEGLTQATIALAGRGRFALQAGISGLHARAATWEQTDWVSIAALYDTLAAVWPSPAVLLGRILARSRLAGADLDEAARAVEALRTDADGALGRQCLAAIGELRRRQGRPAEAGAAYRLAIADEPNEAVRAFLERQVI